MDKAKRKKLERAGWSTDWPAEFLGLGDDEAAFVERDWLSARNCVRDERIRN